MRFKITRNKVCPNRLNIEKDGQRCVLFLGDESCLLFLLERSSDSEAGIKAANEIHKACLHIFGRHDPYGLSCATRCDILELNDEFIVDGEFFIKPITEEKIIEFIKRFGDKESQKLLPPLSHCCSQKELIIKLLKRYDEEKYISYITTISYTQTEKEDDYDIYDICKEYDF